MKTRAVVLVIVAVLVIAGVLVVGLLPNRVDGGVEHQVRAFVDDLQAAGLTWATYDLVDFVANIVFFVPIGLLGALLLPRRVWWLAIPIGAGLSAALELGQAAFLPQRYASATDVLANTIGAVLGALVGLAIREASRRRAPRSAPR
jgi:hypothetical protein